MSDQGFNNEAELWFDCAARAYAPGDPLVASYRLGGWGRAGVTAIETSILWRTTGLGEEDFGVHWFDRRRVEPAEYDAEKEFSTTLPPSPLSYDGQILRVGWIARLRGFFPEGRQRAVEESFLLLPTGDDSQTSPNRLGSAP